jgi:hypothetical protein
LKTKPPEVILAGRGISYPERPKEDGTYVVEFKTAAGQAMAISIPRTEAAVIRHFQERMPYGLFVPEVPFQMQPFSWGSGA